MRIVVQSNGKLERYHRSLKSEAIRLHPPDSEQQARSIVGGYVHQYNHERLHGAIGYITPIDKLLGKAKLILDQRQRKLDVARKLRIQQTRYLTESLIKTGESMITFQSACATKVDRQ